MSDKPPSRFLLRPAGVLTQLASAACLLIGTISIVLVLQNKSGGLPLAIGWGAAAMIGLVLGGLMARGGLLAVIGGGVVALGLGTVLLVIDRATVASILRLLPASDVATIAGVLSGLGGAMLGIGALALISIPQARRYHRALREAEAEATASGIWDVPAIDEASYARAMAAATGPGGYAPPPAGASGGAAQTGGSYPGSAPGGSSPGGSYPGVSNLPRPPSIPSLAPHGFSPPAAGSFGPPSGGSFGPPAGGSFGGTAPSPPPLPMIGLVPPTARTGENMSPALPPPPTSPGAYPPHAGPAADPTRPVIPTSPSTSPGWAPAPARTYRTAQLTIRAPAEERKTRRRVYIALGGLAIGLGIGIGVVVSIGSSGSSGSSSDGAATPPTTAAGSGGAGSGGPAARVVVPTEPGTEPPPSATTELDAGAPAAAPLPSESVRTLIAAQREAIAKADAKALSLLVGKTAFAFGPEGSDVVEGRDDIEALLQRQLADAPPDGFSVESRFLAVGEERNHAWTAEEIELTAPGEAPRRIAITQLCAFVDGAWSVQALHWGRPVADATAERLAILGTLPRAAPVPGRATGGGDLETAVRAAFGSRSAFAEARSERPDAFNFGSAPGERIVGGAKIKAVFSRLRAGLAQSGGARVAAGGAWDPYQGEAPWIGFAAVNVDFTSKTRAATDLTVTFRVLAILLREGDTWRIVQTQFSHAGPI